VGNQTPPERGEGGNSKEEGAIKKGYDMREDQEEGNWEPHARRKEQAKIRDARGKCTETWGQGKWPTQKNSRGGVKKKLLKKGRGGPKDTTVIPIKKEEGGVCGSERGGNPKDFDS